MIYQRREEKYNLATNITDSYYVNINNDKLHKTLNLQYKMTG